VVHYRLTLTGLRLDFTGVNVLAFVVYASGWESICPGTWSDVYDPALGGYNARMAKIRDPIPPAATFNPPPISWTALPDARGIARGILTWTGDENATGYYVWEATESGLLGAFNRPDPLPESTMEDRAAELQALIAENGEASRQWFTRLNDEPITETLTEVLLPAAASTLYAYRISAISASRVESPPSDKVAFFAVPRRNTPKPPRLVLRRAMVRNGSGGSVQTGIRVIVLPVEKVTELQNQDLLEPPGYPVGYRVFRVRRADLAGIPTTEPVAMGPPRFDESAGAWQPYPKPPPEGSEPEGWEILDETAHPSWYPYYYRATAIGRQDIPREYGGESDYSVSQSEYFLPQNPPEITIVSQDMRAGAVLLAVKTDLPLSLSPLSQVHALVEVLQIVSDPENPGRMRQDPVISPGPDNPGWTPGEIPEEIPELPSGSVGTPWHGPQIPGRPRDPPRRVPGRPLHGPPWHLPPPEPVVPRLGRSGADLSERWTLYVLLPYNPGSDEGKYTLRLTDPLGRRKELPIGRTGG
jgi:hypothetical protein